jgi:ABC-type glycerol-3-phosphate transport system permease component
MMVRRKEILNTMYVSGGLIPGFILMKELHLIDTFAVYILPGLVSAFNVFIIRSFIDGLPYALQESAKLDGAKKSATVANAGLQRGSITRQ